MSTHSNAKSERLGPHSDAVTGARALLQNKHRRERREFLAEGPACVSVALDAGLMRALYTTEPDAALVHDARANGVRVYVITDKAMAQLSDTVTPQGLVAVCAIPEWDVRTVLAGSTGPIVVAAGISDPGNLGTIIRTAAAVGAAAVITTEGSSDFYSGKVVRSTVGTFAKVALLGPLTDAAAIAALGDAGIPILAATGNADVDLYDPAVAELTSDRHAWVIGSEAHGLNDTWIQAAAMRVRIPMVDGVESLNAATAAAVCLYARRA